MSWQIRRRVQGLLQLPGQIGRARTTSRKASRWHHSARVEVLEPRLVLATSPVIEVRQFDFNTVDSPTEAGWVGVKKSDLYSSTTGYGWESLGVSDKYDWRVTSNNVAKDFHSGKSGKFQVLVEPGSSYNVELFFRDSKAHEFTVAIESGDAVTINTPKQVDTIQSFANVVSTDSILTLQFTAPQARETFLVNGLRISGGRVTPNKTPIATDDGLTVNEDSTATFNALANDLDPDGDPLSIASFTQPANGYVTNSAGSFTYTPNQDFHGIDSFSYLLSDGRGGTDTALVNVVVNPVSDSPVARDDFGPGFETVLDVPFRTASVLSNDSDPDLGDVLTVNGLDTTSTAGTVTPNGDGTFGYTPSPGFTGSDVFGYEVRDSSGNTASATVTVVVHPAAIQGSIWISTSELMALPTSGVAWDTLMTAANSTASFPDLSNQDDNTDVLTLAKALVGVRLGNQQLIAQARANIMAAIGTEDGGRTLALARNLASFVIAADLVGLPSQDDATFRAWLRTVLDENLSGRTLKSTHEDRPNNWGTMAGASRAAVAVYLGDTAELARTAQVFKGYLGDRSSYKGFNYGSDLTWQADPVQPVGINPKGAMKDGHSIDGVLPDDMRRGGAFSWPPEYTGYPWEALQGVLVQAEILHRAGYDAWQWQDKAVLRAVDFLYSLGWNAQGDDQFQPWLINARYGTSLPASLTAKHGKIMGWTAWTHQNAGGSTGGTEMASTWSSDPDGVIAFPNTSGATSSVNLASSSQPISDSGSATEDASLSISSTLLSSTQTASTSSTSEWDLDDVRADSGQPLDAELDQIFADWP